MSFFSFLNDRAGVAELFQHYPSRYLPITKFIQQIMRGESKVLRPNSAEWGSEMREPASRIAPRAASTSSGLTTAQRELIAAYVSGLNGCEYCYEAHKAIAVSLNVDEQVLSSLLSDLSTADIEERLRPLLAYVRKLTLTPSKMTQSDVEAVLAADWNEQALEDAICVCALFNLMNRLIDGCGIDTTNQDFSLIAQAVNTHGYEAPMK